MFDFLKKKENPVKEEPKKTVAKEAEKDDTKKAEREAEREKHIQSVMEKTGWDRKTTVDKMKDSRAICGVRYKDYDRYDFFAIPEEKQKAEYIQILGKREMRKLMRAQERVTDKEHAITEVMDITGWDRARTEEMIAEARQRTGCAYKEYLIYRFYELDKKTQEETFLMHDSKKLSAKYDVDAKFVKMLCNKAMTDEYFGEFLRRPWCVNTKISLEEFTEKFAESKRVIYKPLDGNRGKGVEAFNVSRENAKEVYDELVTFPEGVVEEYVVQHHDMSAMCPSSVNTIRIVTLSSNSQMVGNTGKHMDVAYAALRIGGGGSIVDNFHSGGMVAAIDLATGELVTDAADMAGHVFANHPTTGTKIKGFKVPYFQEALQMVHDAWEMSKIEGYLGWDIAITENGPVLIEINLRPGVVLLSMPYAPEHKGMRHVMEKYL